MSVIKIPTSFNIDVEFEIPEFYRRLISLLIDMVIQFCYMRIAFEIFKSIANSSGVMDGNTGYNLEAIAVILFLPLFIYHVVLEITMNGQSIGKKIMGLRVVNENGGKASISQFLIRWLLRVSDVWIVGIIFVIASAPDFREMERTFLILGVLGFLITDIVLVVSSRKGQRVCDVLARAILIRTSRKASIEETVFREVSDAYTPVFPQIMQLSDRDINAIKNILETARKKGDYEMAAAASDKIKNHLKIETSMQP